jgi:hypothetical protein
MKQARIAGMRAPTTRRFGRAYRERVRRLTLERNVCPACGAEREVMDFDDGNSFPVVVHDDDCPGSGGPFNPQLMRP